MILGFKPQFKGPILNGTKIHSIRADKHDRWKRLRVIDFATGVRTKNYNRFYRCLCNSTQTILIKYRDDHTIDVFVNGRYLFMDEIYQLAKNDGFKNVEEFYKWFDIDFEGKIIHWTNFRY